MNRDTIDKIVDKYVSAVSTEDFTYKGRVYRPKTMKLSPLLFRGYTCPPMCGGCCPRFTLDYLPTEPHPYQLKERSVTINGKSVSVWSDTQTESKHHFCKNLELDSRDPSRIGRCNIHQQADSSGHTGQPFSCDFEVVTFVHYEHEVRVLSKLFARGWKFLRVDGDRGARCEMLPENEERKLDVIRKFKRLAEWTDYLGINHRIDKILDWANEPEHLEIKIL